MGTNSIDLVCSHCNQTFAAFLEDLAAKNLKVVCPNCGKDNEPPAKTAAGALPGKQ
ncbi:MAG: hypothetical protein ACRD3L_15005 [Terriglobales bacterium]